MNVVHTNAGHIAARLRTRIGRVLAYSVAALAFLNALYFVLRGTNPVMRDDDWYFLDVFLRKAIDGTLGFADFFVKRMGPDHAQPLFKVVLFAEWRYFDLDLTLGAILGVLAAMGCALVYLRLLSPRRGHDADFASYLSWAAICALLFSLNGGSASQWTWPLNALVNITNLIILLFLWATWRAHCRRRYVLLIVATLFLGFSSDDTGMITAIAAVLSLLLMGWADSDQRVAAFWKTPLIIVLCMAAVRIIYTLFPVVGGGIPHQTFSTELGLLIQRFGDQGWWMWAICPLTVPVSDINALHSLGLTSWLATIIIGLLLLAAHVWFWSKAFRCRYNRTIFVAVATMLVMYGYIAGIVLFRVGWFGNEDMEAPRYIVMFNAHLIALLLMWAATRKSASQSSRGGTLAIVRLLPAIGCMCLLFLQIPLSIHAWRTLPYLHIAYTNMAAQIDTLASHPERQMKCVPELPVCNFPNGKRTELTRMLSENKLNVFSPWVQGLHSYLPKLAPISPGSSEESD